MGEDADGKGANPNPYGTEKLVQAGDTNRYGTKTAVPLIDIRGARENDLSDGIPDYYNWASHLHAETFGE